MKSLLVALVLLAAGSAFGQDCVPFRVVNHRTIVLAKVNGAGPYAFLLDTGSQWTLIDPNISKAVSIPGAGVVDVSGLGLHDKTSWSMLDSLEVSGHVRNNLKAVVYDLTKTQGPEDARIYGIIGHDFLDQYVVTIDYRRGCFILQ